MQTQVTERQRTGVEGILTHFKPSQQVLSHHINSTVYIDPPTSAKSSHTLPDPDPDSAISNSVQPHINSGTITSADPLLKSNASINSPICWGCNKPIDSGKAIQFADGVWHLNCKLIDYSSNLLFLANGKPICSDCTYSCSLCNKSIFDEAIVTAEGTYHSECFRCNECKEKIQGKSFAKTNSNVIYCVPCYYKRKERRNAALKKQQNKLKNDKNLPKTPLDKLEEASKLSTRTKNNPPPIQIPDPKQISKIKQISPQLDTSENSLGEYWVEYERDSLNAQPNSAKTHTSPYSPIPSSRKKSSPTEKLKTSFPSSQNGADNDTSRQRQQSSPNNITPTATASSNTASSPNPNIYVDKKELEQKYEKKIKSIQSMNSSTLRSELKSSYETILMLHLELLKLKGVDDSQTPKVTDEAFHSKSYPNTIIKNHDIKNPSELNSSPTFNDKPISKKAENFLGLASSHQFATFNTLRPVRCDICGDIIWGINNKELKCKSCGLVCHQRCLNQNIPVCSYSNRKRDISLPNGLHPSSDAVTADIPKEKNSPKENDKDRNLNNDANNRLHAHTFSTEIEIYKWPLEEQVKYEGSVDGITWVVKASIQFIEKHGIDVEGIYRKSGSTSDVKLIQTRMSNILIKKQNLAEAEIAESTVDVCAVTSILKQYFRELPIPLLSFDLYQNWITLFNTPNASDQYKITMCRKIAQSLPECHAATLVYLLRHLKRISENSKLNLMSISNLSLVFAPNLLRLPNLQFDREVLHMSATNIYSGR
ncbi:hypothetical protein BB560_007316, partial [Smittium megazygosporum]